ncbi:uncharacterized protein LOC130948875 [Arachis stenosperma]|uniref:uncharacterized protein LOC130948875 n=1 Tax=Arachis stenosperma TaxID=217475 RepID=UPI0025AB86E5|nr:uncharacterized protein LOC130948875 [Arachis stenosperma]
MVEAHLDIVHDGVKHVGWVPDLLHALRKTKFLALRGHTTQCLFSGQAFKFPEFPGLLNLELDVPSFKTNFLLNFLHNCYVLESLVIHDVFEGVDLLQVEYYGSTSSTMVPNCVTSHLKNFEFRGYQNSCMSVNLSG